MFVLLTLYIYHQLNYSLYRTNQVFINLKTLMQSLIYQVFQVSKVILISYCNSDQILLLTIDLLNSLNQEFFIQNLFFSNSTHKFFNKFFYKFFQKMTSSLSFEITINIKNYCQITTNMFHRYADKHFKGKFL